MRRRLVAVALCAALSLTMLVAAPQEARAEAGDVKLVSCDSSGEYGTGGASQTPSISAGGRYVAFCSTAGNLLPGISGSHIYRKDIASEEVSLCSSSSSEEPGGGSSSSPDISSDGTYVTFRSTSTNLIPGHPTAPGRNHIFRKDLVTGEVMLCSAAPDGQEGGADSGDPSISADGRYVAFRSYSGNLVSGTFPGRNHVFRKDLATGEVMLCSVAQDGQEGSADSIYPSISSDGGFVAFFSYSTNLIPGHPTAPGRANVFRKELATDEVMLCSESASGVDGNRSSDYPDISSNGRYVTFQSEAGNLLDGLVTSGKQIFRKDLQAGEVSLCSSTENDAEGNNPSQFPSISADGGYVSFQTQATNLSTEADNGKQHVLRKHVASGEVTGCSISSSGHQGDGTSEKCDISSDGKYVVFDSAATDLIDDDATSGYQVFRKELACNTFFYFAEGYTGAGFQEYLCLGNPGEAEIDVAVTYVFKDGDPETETLQVPAGSRVTVNVNAEVGAERDVSIRTASRDPFVAERPIYFDYGAGWTGGHDVLGASCPNTSWYFAEGYTGPGFEEWVCVLNPGLAEARLIFRFQTQEAGEMVRTGYSVPAASRATFKVNEVLGANYQASLTLQSDQPVVAERPMYFNYSGTGGWGWTGGHCVMGTDYLKREYYFAEGYTGPGFEEWLTLQNPNPLAIEVTAVYQFADGTPPSSYPYSIPAETRETIYVPDEVGLNRDVSVKLTCDSPFLAERPMYFEYSGTGGYGWTGGHCVIGASFRRNDLFFAEGYTGPGFEEWLCIQNPGSTTSHVRITYYTQEEGELPAREADIPASSRVTFNVNTHAGANYQLSSRVEVISGSWIIVERPMYFDYNGWTGGHDVVGYGL